MSALLAIKSNPKTYKECTEEALHAFKDGAWVQFFKSSQSKLSIPNIVLPKGPGFVVASGGTSGGKKYCLLPLSHFDQSAQSTAAWLSEEGLDPKRCVLFNPLPMHHVSGLMPWWRSQQWGTEHVWLLPELLRDPLALQNFFSTQSSEDSRPKLLSLVPTQLQRLISHSVGLEWLKNFSVIWVGGAGLNSMIEDIARSENIHLAPCYGATETAAMVTVLPPKEFLAGMTGCGFPLKDVQLRLASDGALMVKTPRLAKALLGPNGLEALCDNEGWWCSADLAKLDWKGDRQFVEIIGRNDLAVNSGGETVFPDQLEGKLMASAIQAGLPIQNVLFLSKSDIEWGSRLVALVRWEDKVSLDLYDHLLRKLSRLVDDWEPAERPFSWHFCPELSPDDKGKWQRKIWQNWLTEHT